MNLEAPSPQERAEFTRQLEERLRDWLDREGLTSKKDPSEDASFHYMVPYPGEGGVQLNLLRPKDRDCLAITLGIHLSPEHEEPFRALDDDARKDLVHEIRREAFRDGLVGFGPEMDDGVPVRWQLDLIIYDPQIDKHTVLSGMKRVFTRHLQIVEILNQRLGQSANGASGSESELRGYL